jgi:D-alanyl-D-alanine carboxypeptidase/D-alanyl-D-alanine-endopeptidase (penicillin-binding protein 4)
MRRYLLPAVVLAVVVAASILTSRANDAAEPDTPADTTADPLTTPLFSARRAPEWLRQPTNDNILRDGVEAAMSELPDIAPACVSVHRGGESIAEVNSDLSFIPGDLQRLTTLAAMQTVGSGGFTTAVVRDINDPIEEGVLQGNLYIIGGADPVLSTGPFISRFPEGTASTSLVELAVDTVEQLRADGISEIAGGIVGVDLKYAGNVQSNTNEDAELFVWTEPDIGSNAVGITDGLLVDNGFQSFDADLVDPSARVRAASAETHVAGELRGMIQFGGIMVTGEATVGEAPEAAARESVAEIDSPPLQDIAQRALTDATTAEMLFRELALRDVGEAHPLAATFKVLEVLQTSELMDVDELGNTANWDGSGLSDLDRGTCRLFADILDRGVSLPVEAITGVGAGAAAACAPTTLESLDVIASARPSVTSAAGRVMAANGDLITFAVIVNWIPDAETGELAPRGVCDDVVPAVLDAIAAHPGGPDIDDLTPLPVVTNS